MEQKVVVASAAKFVKSNHAKTKWAFRKPFAIILGRMRKNLKFILTILISTYLFWKPKEVFAWDLTEYIAGSGFVEHSLSTGEYIWFTAGGGSGGVRQYKNSNYEQFFIKADGYYRREDTSWAPRSGFQDAHCTNGNKAIYALDPDSTGSFPQGTSIVSSGAFWAPSQADTGNSWDTGAHTIVPIDSGVPTGIYTYNLPPLISCNLSDLGGYPASVPKGNQQIQIEAHYNPKEFTFCTGATNPEELLVLKVLSGPGTGDTFYYMKGWGLVGFETPGWEAGLSSGPGVIVGEKHAPSCIINYAALPEKVPRTIIGKITSSKVEKDAITGSTETSKPVEGATICVYQGAGGDKLPYYIPNFEASGVTDENGRFVVNSFLRYRAPDTGIGVASYKSRYNFLAVFCGNEKIAQLVRVDLNALQRTNMPARYADLFEGIDPRTNTEILSPIELTILCDSTEAGTSFPRDVPADAHNPSEPHNMADSNAGLDGWQYAANPHYELRAADNSNTDAKCPQYLPYTDRRSRAELSCSGSNPRELNPVAHGAEVWFDLDRSDPQYNGKTWFGILPIPQFDLLREQDQFEGKVGMQSAADPMPDVLANVMHILTGGFLTGPKKLPDNPEMDGLFEVYSCQQIKESNMSYNPGSDINMQKQGLLNLLAFPYTESETGIKAMYNKANKNIIICTLENGQRITLGEIQPYQYMVEDMSTWCEPSEPPLCDPATNPDCIEGDAGCRYVLNNYYFPSMQVIRSAISTSAELNTTREEVRNDHYDTDERRTKWALGQANVEDPFDDGTYEVPAQADTCSSAGSCGAAAASKIEAPGSMGLTSHHAARFLLDTTDMGIYEEDGTTEIQPIIGLLGPFTGFEDKQVAFTKTSHAILLNEAMCVIPQLDGHNEHSVKIAAIPKGDSDAGSENEGQPGTFESAFDFELECDADHCGTEKTTAEQFYQVPHLISPFAFLKNIFSIFWGNSPDSCIDEGSSTIVICKPWVEDCDYCDSDMTICYNYDLEPNKWECDGEVPTVRSQFNVAVRQTVDMQKGFNNLNIALESFMLPSPMRVANEMSGFGVIDSQSDDELTLNNEDGFGGLMETVESDPSDMVDKLRELVRMPTAIYND